MTTLRCQCAKPRPALIVNETFGGLFTDTPLEATDEIMCDRCSGEIRAERPCAPLGPSEFQR